MTQQKGVTSKIQIGYESSYKTVATEGFVMPFNSEGVRPNQPLNRPGTITGTRNPTQPFGGNKDANGPLVIPIDSVALWYWLKAMFSDPVTTGADPYVHEFKIGDTMPSFTYEKQFTDLATDVYSRFLGCKIATFGMTLGGDGELVGNISAVGASHANESSSFDGSPTTPTLTRLENFEAALTEGGGALSNATEISINVDFGLDTGNYVIGGSGVRGSLPEGLVGVSGSLKTLFEDTTLLAKALAGTESGLKLTITGGSSSVFELEIQELQYALNAPEIPGPQGLLVDLNFQGFYSDGSEASALVARLTNSEAHS